MIDDDLIERARILHNQVDQRDPLQLEQPNGQQPAAIESWCCPNCGRPAETYVSQRRIVACGACRWTFRVELVRHFDRLGRDPYRGARDLAEVRE